MVNVTKKWRTLKWKIKSKAVNYRYGFPAKKLKIIGITGTNGKTTVATLLYKTTTALGYKVGLISTVENIIGEKVIPHDEKSPGTTPDSISLTKLFDQMVKEGCIYVFMEVSSHAADQRRVAGIKFTGGIFTNLTQDHLDYHKSMEKYFLAKKKFFNFLPKNAFALSNIDDPYGEKMLDGIKAKKYTYGFKNVANFNEKIKTKLLGEFNAYNVLVVYATTVLLGLDKIKVKEIIKNLEPVAGRFNHFKSESGITGIVDFAHTPDALLNVLKTIQNISAEARLSQKSKIITLFGCGGDRDTSKRPLMAKIVYDNSDITIATSDNSRSEDIQNIFSDMKKGLPISQGQSLRKEIYFIEKRDEAIKKACELAKSGDIILLAGKGHEQYQEIKGVKYPFNDMEELKKYLPARNASSIADAGGK